MEDVIPASTFSPVIPPSWEDIKRSERFAAFNCRCSFLCCFVLNQSATNFCQMADEVLAFPWAGVLANVRDSLTNASEGLDYLQRNGIPTITVKPLYQPGGCSGYAIVEFAPDWTGYVTTIKFDKYFYIQKKVKLHWVLDVGKKGFYG